MGLKQYLNMNRDMLVKALLDRDALIEHLMRRDADEEAEQLRARLRQRDAQIAILKSSLARETMRTPA